MSHFAFIVLSIVILLIMVLIHEAGHYTAAKILGFTVDEFSVGFGPKIFGKRRKNGELFSLRMLPLGGYCAFYGETDDEDDKKSADKNTDTAQCAEVNPDAESNPNAEEKQNDVKDEDLLSYVMRSKIEDDEKPAESDTAKAAEDLPTPRLDKNGNPAITFNAQKPWKRIIVLLGGVLFNFLSAIIFSLIYIWAVGFPTLQVAEVYGDTGAPDLMSGDIILSVDGNSVSVMDTFEDLVSDVNEGETVTINVLRDGKEVSIEATRRKIKTEVDGKESEYVGFGFSSHTVFIGDNAANGFKYCVPYTFKLSWSILGSFGSILTGKQSITTMSGPVGSINFMAQVAAADWRNILILLPLLASNLAIFNLLPFPALDGAHIVFTVIEWIRKKPINRKVESMIHFVGMIVLLLFVLIVDILSFAL